jgi:hypothetical protein
MRNLQAARAALLVMCLLLLCPGLARAAKGPTNSKPNRIRIAYVAPTNPAFQPIQEQVKQEQLLEKLQDFLSPIRLPVPLLLKIDSCDGESNAWYEESDHSVTVCYEYLDEVMRNVPTTTTPGGVTPRDAWVGPAVEVFLHEIGHALFNILKVPVLGREEDAADQVAAYVLLRLTDNLARSTVSGVAYMYGHEAQAQNPQHKQFADVHGLPAQRFYNLLCMAYGSDPKLFGYVVEKRYLPESRAETCEDEYRQVDYAVKQLIGPHIDRTLQKKMRARKLMKPEKPPG